MQLAYAITIHKSQGLTLDKAVINIGPKELNIGLTYVAISRIKRLKGLAFETGFNYEQINNFKNNLFKQRLRCESLMHENRLNQLYSVTS